MQGENSRAFERLLWEGLRICRLKEGAIIMEKANKRLCLHLSAGENLVVERHQVDQLNRHWHNFYEMEIILSGSGSYFINDAAYELPQYNVFLLTTTDFHSARTEAPVELINISFDEKFLDESNLLELLFPRTEKAYALEAEELARIVAAAELLEHECRIDGKSKKQLLQYILNSLFQKSSSFQELGSQGVKKAVIYMKEHFREPITLSMLAAEAGYHPAYFSELFKKYTGETYTEFLNNLRLGYARTLLANGVAVSQVCFLSGFNSLSNFGAIFKKNYHISPREYVKTLMR